ncbi:MAG: flagellar assembly peptidoglycan hydrolase FlgJ [Sterolibacterium sp.]|nr:flagellar assembly peptidoglycan hydrolase FlgJ [Sterolibacterium sp.]
MTTPVSSQSTQLALDLRGLDALRQEARVNTPAANKAIAQQFEALFLQIVLKTMRDATPREGLFDSEQARMFESIHDQQLAQVLSTTGKGLGLAAMIEKQLAQLGASTDVPPLGELPLHPAAPALPLDSSAGLPVPPVMTEDRLPVSLRTLKQTLVGARATAAPLATGQSTAPALDTSTSPPPDSVVPATSSAPFEVSAGARRFIEQVWPHAQQASRATGIPAHFMVAQAALETGWGKAEPRLPDGSPSHNLFGIKASRDWSGPVVESMTTEVVNGLAQREKARFRVYASHAEAFQDYARLLASSPRYADVLGTRDAVSFARGLQQAGYATDPLYASKLARIIEGPTLRSGLQQS